MTIIQYATLRNRIDGILGSGSPAKLKENRLASLLDDLLIGFASSDRYARDLYQEVYMEIDNL